MSKNPRHKALTESKNPFTAPIAKVVGLMTVAPPAPAVPRTSGRRARSAADPLQHDDTIIVAEIVAEDSDQTTADTNAEIVAVVATIDAVGTAVAGSSEPFSAWLSDSIMDLADTVPYAGQRDDARTFAVHSPRAARAISSAPGRTPYSAPVATEGQAEESLASVGWFAEVPDRGYYDPELRSPEWIRRRGQLKHLRESRVDSRVARLESTVGGRARGRAFPSTYLASFVPSEGTASNE